MFSQVTVFIHKIGDRTYHLMIDPLAPVPEVKDALCAMLKEFVILDEQWKAQQIAPPAVTPIADTSAAVENTAEPEQTNQPETSHVE